MAPVIALTLILAAAAQAPSTMAAVAIFNVNVDRKWPVDEREPAVTAEALRLMEAAVQAVIEERKLDAPKLRQSISAFTQAREALGRTAEDKDRAPLVRDALLKGRMMAESVASATGLSDEATRQRLAGLKTAADAFDRARPVRDQADILERYFRTSSELLHAILAARVL